MSSRPHVPYHLRHLVVGRAKRSRTSFLRPTALGWHPNSGNPIGNGWQGFRHVFGGSDDTNGFHRVVYGVAQNGDLRWYGYDGNGEPDRSGALGWRANSGNFVGNGW